MSSKPETWQEANQSYLMAALVVVREALLAKVDEKETLEISPGKTFYPKAQIEPPPALEQLCRTFGLSSFERDVLLLCAGMELENSWASLCAKAQGDSQRNYPTFSLALAVLPDPDWGAIAPDAPLRQWRLIEVGPGHALTTSPLRIDERILHYLVGVSHVDERLVGMVEPVYARRELVPSHWQLAEQLAATWLQGSDVSEWPTVQLCGDEVASKRAIASAACAMLQMHLYVISADAIPTGSDYLNQLMRLWRREAALSRRVLLLECDEIGTLDAARESAIARLSDRMGSPLIISSYERRPQGQRPLITFDIHKPTPSEQRLIWHNALGEMASSLNGQVEALVSQFNLSRPAIDAACAGALGRLAAQGGESETASTTLGTVLWDASRAQARPRLSDLAQHIEVGATWEDLVLPEAQRQILREVAAHVRQRAKVYESWGFAGKGGRGLGISALFAGGSGTGKTTAAEVLAGELRLDLYRIDLSSVVSKYIGETEKNLRRVFDAAETGGAILLFDEADAIFGKRSEVKDSHDRHANIEVSYLLQRMESYRGLAILTTNMKNALDQAFLRRIRFVVQFPFPDATQRAEIWRRVFPKDTPTEKLDVNKLAKLSVAGGNIRNIAMNAAFLAAEAGEPVKMKHLLQAAKSEYVKMERPMTDVEIKGWV